MILILGAGVFGLTAALALRERGHRVRVLDGGRLPHEAGSSVDSSRAVRMDYGSDEQHTELARRALIGWRGWNERAAQPLYYQDGMLFLTRAAWTPGAFEAQSYALLERRGARVERLDEGEIQRRYPMFRPGAYVDGYLSHEAGWADARRTVAFLLERARSAGVEVRAEEGALELLRDGDRIKGVRTAAEAHTAEHVLVAAGPWTPKLVPDLATRLEPCAQPVLYVRPPAGDERWRGMPVWAADISTTGWYAFPADGEGLVKIGHHGPGRIEDPDGPRDVHAEDHRQVCDFFEADVPSLAGAEIVRARSCFYTDTSDGDFLIDRHPDLSGLSVATGGNGHGFKFAPVLGELIADAVEGRESSELQRYRWDRPLERRSEACRFEG